LNGKIHYKWPISIAMLVYQRVRFNQTWYLPTATAAMAMASQEVERKIDAELGPNFEGS
jgi:hypothetical protein